MFCLKLFTDFFSLPIFLFSPPVIQHTRVAPILHGLHRAISQLNFVGGILAIGATTLNKKIQVASTYLAHRHKLLALQSAAATGSGDSSATGSATGGATGSGGDEVEKEDEKDRAMRAMEARLQAKIDRLSSGKNFFIHNLSGLHI